MDARMLKTLLRFLKNCWGHKAKPKAEQPPPPAGYTKEEAQKVKERLQGLGYLE